MIKVGQIYENAEHCKRYVVTKPYHENTRFDLICNDGATFGLVWENDILYIGKLIAEYPSWQEAVNSKEFIGEK